jgi:DNA-directed RNA polymerase subunit K/omega
MLHPTIDELTKGKYNRYELALATARCARLVTDEYVRQHDAAEKSITGNKETDKPLNTMIDKELRDEKAVKVAVGRLYRGEYEIDETAALASEEETAEENAEATDEAAAEETSAADAE